MWGATPPEVLIGDRTWPTVTLGPLLTTEREAGRVRRLSDPTLLYGKPLSEVIALRSRLIRSMFRIGIRTARKPERLLEITRELGTSSEPIDAEAKFKKPPKPILRFDGILAPAGPRATVIDLKVVGNPIVPKQVDSIVSDTDLRAAMAVLELYDHGTSTYYISRLLSIGLLGRPKDRLLVPSRWSITATDAAISARLKERIVEFDELGEILLFSQEYIGNRYEILLLPSSFAFELIEIVHPGCVYTPSAQKAYVFSDYETWRRKTAFSHMGGGYYAIRLPICEYLYRIRRQAFAFVIREVTPEYYAPVGSWKIREALRAVFRERPKRFGAIEEALRDMASRISLPAERWFEKAKHLRAHIAQMRIEAFLRL